MGPLLERLHEPRPVEHSRLRVWSARAGDVPVLAVIGGMGKTNGAHALTSVLEGHEANGVIGFGVGGAYPSAGLELGDLAVATAEHYGDEGVETPGGWISCEGIGIPLFSRGDRRYFNEFPVDRSGHDTLREELAGEDFTVGFGPFVTVSSCSGTTERGLDLGRRFGAICETMEGAAYAHVAALYSLPFFELRGISNQVEDRDVSSWRLAEAAVTAAQGAATAAACWRSTTAGRP